MKRSTELALCMAACVTASMIGAASQAPKAAPEKQATAQAGAQSGAKALFYDPVTGAPAKTAGVQPAEDRRPVTAPGAKVRSTRHPVKVQEPARVKFVGVHYWIELEGTGPVTADHPFKTGDRFKLHVRSNVDGYLALWTLDPEGRGTMLFPTDGKETSSLVKADDEYVTPGFISFKPPVQEERLLVFFSRTKTELPTPASLPQVKTEADVVARTLGPSGARSLVFESDRKTPEEVGDYVVNKNGGPVAKEIRLRHQEKQ